MDSIMFLGFSLYDIVFYFFIYSFLGWCIEVSYAYFSRGYFVNRGFLYGPFTPIYGVGSLSIILLLNNFKDNILLLFILATILTSALEYITAVILENVFKSKWWDYSEDPFNIKGRICLYFSLAWGAAAAFMVKFIQPLVEKAVSSVDFNIGIILFYCIIVYFIVDFILTLVSLIEFNKVLEKLNLGAEKYSNFISSSKKKAYSTSKDLTNKVSSIKGLKFNHIRLIKSFPNVKSFKFDTVLKSIKEKLFNKDK